MESWYKKFGESMKDNELTIDEITSLREEWDRIINEGLALRDNIASATGYDQTAKDEQQQSASSRGFETMMQNQASELNGRFTALQEAGYQISDLNRQQLDVLLSILSLMPKELLLGGMEKAQNLVLSETPMAQGLQSDETIKATMSQVLIGVNALVISSDRTSIAISEIRNLMATSTGYLEDISVCNQKMLKEFGAKMDAMNTKLNNL